jgi:hypothetical protein
MSYFFAAMLRFGCESALFLQRVTENVPDPFPLLTLFLLDKACDVEPTGAFQQLLDESS